MSTSPTKNPPRVLLVGGGIGGMAAALALARLGVSIDLLEQSATIGEIGAGLQLGPNAFAALDALGVGEAVRRNSVFTDRLVMMDAVDCGEVASVPVGEAFRARFKNPYAVSHRADLHGAIHEAVKQHPLIRFHTSAQVESIDIGGGKTQGVVAVTRDGRRFTADAIVGCDGVKSVVRAQARRRRAARFGPCGVPRGGAGGRHAGRPALERARGLGRAQLPPGALSAAAW